MSIENIFRADARTLITDILPNKLKEAGYLPLSGEKYLYAPGEIPVLVTAHVDTVHYTEPKLIVNDKEKGILWSPEGIGGDDRAGILVIEGLLQLGYHPHILFLDEEETGCVGAKQAIKELPMPDVRFIIDFDRKGSNDCVFYNCDNKDFTKYIESFGFETAIGSCSDISVLCPAWGIAGVNLSVGYYNQHTRYEYVIISEINNTVKKAAKIFESLPEKTFKYIPKPIPKKEKTKWDLCYWGRKELGPNKTHQDDDSDTSYLNTSQLISPSVIWDYQLSKNLGVDKEEIREVIHKNKFDIRRQVDNYLENAVGTILMDYLLGLWEHKEDTNKDDETIIKIE